MAKHNAANLPLVLILGPVQVIAHDTEEVNVGLYFNGPEPAQVPVARGMAMLMPNRVPNTSRISRISET
jgi:hypothetical protein